ncbi:MAG: hypothetical protein EOP51_30385, partial [Sphingobacteriales bacterium]
MQRTKNEAEEDQQAQFVSVVLADTEDVWNKLFSEQLGQTYQEPKLVLFTGRDESGCGSASAATTRPPRARSASRARAHRRAP